MKTVGSRGACVRTSVFLAAVLMSIGCPPMSGHGGKVRIQLLNGGGEGGWSVEVSGPAFSAEIYPLPTGPGAYKALEVWGVAGDSIKFKARFTDVSGTVEAFAYCTATVPISSDTGTAYGGITISQAGGAVIIWCCGGWEEMHC